MYFRQLLYPDTACASYLLGCKTRSLFAVVDAHADLVDEYVELAEREGARIAAVLETHVQADHVSGLPKLAERTGATAYMPAGESVSFPHRPLADGDSVELGNTVLRALATPGHARAHNSFLVTDRSRGDEPWLVLTGDSLMVGDVGRPDLHVDGGRDADAMARTLYRSLHGKLLSLPDDLLVYPSHYGGSVCGRGLSSTPVSTIGFERRHNPALAAADEADFAASLLRDVPADPPGQDEIVARNRGEQPLAGQR